MMKLVCLKRQSLKDEEDEDYPISQVVIIPVSWYNKGKYTLSEII